VQVVPPMLRIEINLGEGSKTFRLSGDLRAGDIEGLRANFDHSSEVISLDLENLMIVDLSAVRFLIGCEEMGMRVTTCPPYVREWMSRERDRRRHE
jgi:hypothetical protein